MWENGSRQDFIYKTRQWAGLEREAIAGYPCTNYNFQGGRAITILFSPLRPYRRVRTWHTAAAQKWTRYEETITTKFTPWSSTDQCVQVIGQHIWVQCEEKLPKSSTNDTELPYRLAKIMDLKAFCKLQTKWVLVSIIIRDIQKHVQAVFWGKGVLGLFNESLKTYLSAALQERFFALTGGWIRRPPTYLPT